MNDQKSILIFAVPSGANSECALTLGQYLLAITYYQHHKTFTETKFHTGSSEEREKMKRGFGTITAGLEGHFSHSLNI